MAAARSFDQAAARLEYPGGEQVQAMQQQGQQTFEPISRRAGPEEYPERPVMICFGMLMLALIGLIVVGQINYPADDFLNGFIAPLSRRL